MACRERRKRYNKIRVSDDDINDVAVRQYIMDGSVFLV